MHMHADQGFSGTSYLDDLIGVCDSNSSEEAYYALGELLVELGLIDNLAKASDRRQSKSR